MEHQPPLTDQTQDSSMQQCNLFSSMAMKARPCDQFAEVCRQALHENVMCSNWHPQEFTRDKFAENETGRTLSKTSWTASQQSDAMRTNTQASVSDTCGCSQGGCTSRRYQQTGKINADPGWLDAKSSDRTMSRTTVNTSCGSHTVLGCAL